jgi:hypothetical protein
VSDDFSVDPSNDGDVTEVTTVGWPQRIFQSFVGAVIGIVMVIGSVVLLWWNEGRAVEAIRALDQGGHQIIEISADHIDPAANGRLVHLSGPMMTTAPVRDPVFGVTDPSLLRLKRGVEMYQWVEEKSIHSEKNLGGSETAATTYHYARRWEQTPQDSSRFHEAQGHSNPPMPVRTTIMDTTGARLGAYRVDPALVATIAAFAPFMPPPDATLPEGYRVDGDMLYRGHDSDDPAIGDIRILYSAVTAQTMSAIGVVSNDTLVPYHADSGYEIARVEPGIASAPQMLKEKAREEGKLTWVLRLVGFVVMLFGFLLMAAPLAVLAGVIPLFEDLVDMAGFLLAFVVAAPLTLLVIALAWIVHRPLIGSGLIVAAIGTGFLLIRAFGGRRAVAR